MSISDFSYLIGKKVLRIFGKHYEFATISKALNREIYLSYEDGVMTVTDADFILHDKNRFRLLEA